MIKQILGNKAIGLAPMAGVADRAFREICENFGADFTVSEMVSAKALVMGDKKSRQLMAHTKSNTPFGIQLFGDEPQLFEKAAKIAMDYNPSFIDINSGCPAPKIVRNKGGCSLMRSPDLIKQIVTAVKEQVDIPVSIKIRKGYSLEEVNAVEVAQAAEEAGADFITVHGRTREQMYKPGLDYHIIAKVKQAVNIPVVGNGNIADVDTLLKMEQTGCDYFMVGRGALGAPWVFAELKRFLKDRENYTPTVYTVQTRVEIMKKHITLLCSYKGERIGMKEARKHCAWYLKGMNKAAELRNKAGKLATLEELEQFCALVLQENKEPI